ncbi:MAG: hypothetical protein CVV30_06380 [Methanomicrobiales archaeon HGW-Methanomicrobiales-1]|jgi:hypothetical protein|nr:MAG: hypothetical protein CVV30_06380 [Methanomicrobiales archaeon HGW-Methanomicrobiales-1]
MDQKKEATNNNSPDIPEEWMEWQKYGHSLIKESLKTQDETAKYVIGLVSTVVALYTSILTYFGLSGQANISIFVIIPLLCMLVSLGVALLVFKPEMEILDLNDPVRIMKTVAHRSRHKYIFLSIGIIVFVIGILTIPFVIGIGTVHNPEKVQFVVIEDKKPVFENLSVSFETKSVKTIPLVLVQEDPKTYTIQLSNGNSVKINKEWVQGVIFIKN